MTNPQEAKEARKTEQTHSVGPSGAVAVAQPLTAQKQLELFEAAMKHFHARRLREARDLFVEAGSGPERDVAQRATLHIAMCDRRLQQPAVKLETAEDYYNYGVALINTRNLSEARKHLERALEMTPQADHVHYAMALAQALSGEASGAQNSLRRAIEIDPRNRIAARQDADFASLAGDPAFQALLYPEKKNW
jgi:tetratricopeptide (TPR) repeat protein